MLESSHQDIQEKFQQIIALPSTKNEIDQHLDVDIHVHFPEFDEDIKIFK